MDDFGDRFWSKVQPTGFCWEWIAGKSNGYGKFRLGKVSDLAHRVAYRLMVGPIPDGMTIDHLCRNRACVNPDHLEVVTLAENIRRAYGAPHANRMKEHCLRGHNLSGDNLYVIPSTGSRVCRVCSRAHKAAYKRKMRGKA